ncbi:DsbA family protein [Aurantimonas sp. VKM B-3413]|uniref:DsbA family protein n=1 Tax=Aurantimonas sp. VKM B-3413 TaxID=2779401 RepID=UPI001E37CA3D|nr:DsbA family protein [Aurantimonas sp. VKM B-3413]MCB8837417.1 thioredoxin domain-containing protein [Aurantimonas sp. VKM B-3413]
MPHSVRRTLSRNLALFLAGAGALALAACNDAAKETSADAVVQPGGPVQMAQAETSSGDAAKPAAPASEATAPAVSAANAPEPSGSVDVDKLMAEEALPDVVVGQKDAPVTIVEYASMTCPHCAHFHSTAYPVIKKNYIDTGKAKLILREFPFDPRALAAFMLARCAGDDARRTAMVDVLFDQQDEWSHSQNASAALLKIARLAGMSEEGFKACLNDKDLQQKIVEVQQRGENTFGVDATPTFFVNGDKYSGALTPEEMSAVIEGHL